MFLVREGPWAVLHDNKVPKSQPIPEWERNSGLWPQIQIAAGLNPLRFENRKPDPPLFTGDLNSSNRKPAGRNRRIRAARRPQIAESPATRPLRTLLQNVGVAKNCVCELTPGQQSSEQRHEMCKSGNLEGQSLEKKWLLSELLAMGPVQFSWPRRVAEYRAASIRHLM